ncbi:hypothetical protein HN51_041135 [Arachis hypogaea]|uniref:ALA-interacting subunit n=1 Tax=Arachis hypogaea TaxID=3818 RepID=A0A444YR39_ARAHY|nr:ALA-interacting subunit 1-like isoform X1 [Arachis ipaensis]XP_025658401.1 ALA-interacting subunit 1 [Arachis hypogaea]QHN86832.1 ALA-interacting subunit [Arachis hypogaea]RYR04430.1 hypothetical protein Ahy_B06g084155 [Arachis hypogaea]
MSTDPSTSSAAAAEEKSNKRKSKKPKYSRFTQQELPAWQPILTPRWVITIFTLIALVFIPVGLAAFSASQSVVEVEYEYDTACIPDSYKDNATAYIKDDNTNKTCTQKLSIKSKMQAPIFVYYQLDNFYQNHRRYVKSRSDEQLRTKDKENDVSSCSPEDYVTINNKSEPIVPCGLIAWSLFNDTYKIQNKDKEVVINKTNIAWASDRTTKFGSDVYPKNFQASGLIGGAKLDPTKPLSEQEDLIVWMRTAALPKFRKLYGKIETDLEANDEIVVVIENNYNTYEFGGKKSLVLSTATWIGGRNNFLGIAYVVIGSMSLLLALGFLLLYILKPRPLGDPTYLSWNKNPGGLR